MPSGDSYHLRNLEETSEERRLGTCTFYEILKRRAMNAVSGFVSSTKSLRDDRWTTSGEQEETSVKRTMAQKQHTDVRKRRLLIQWIPEHKLWWITQYSEYQSITSEESRYTTINHIMHRLIPQRRDWYVAYSSEQQIATRHIFSMREQKNTIYFNLGQRHAAAEQGLTPVIISVIIRPCASA